MKNGEEEKKNKKRNERTNKTDSSIGPAVQSHSLVNLFFLFPSLSLSSKLLYKTISFYLCDKSLYTSLSLYVSNLSQTGLLLTVDVALLLPSYLWASLLLLLLLIFKISTRRRRRKRKRKKRRSWLSSCRLAQANAHAIIHFSILRAPGQVVVHQWPLDWLDQQFTWPPRQCQSPC